MASRPLIKGNVVVNVIELGDDTEHMTKARFKQLKAADDADYEARLNAWRDQMRAHRDAIKGAQQKAFMAQGVVHALKEQAAAEGKKRTGDPSRFAKRIQEAEREAEGWRTKIAEMEVSALPPKPRPVAIKRWFHPEDVTVGPPGGNIGDQWDGKRYSKPA
jgi:hypothetical protein